MVNTSQKKKKKTGKNTLHVTFAFINDKSVTSTPPFFVADYPNTFNGSVSFKFASEVRFSRTFMLLDKGQKKA